MERESVNLVLNTPAASNDLEDSRENLLSAAEFAARDEEAGIRGHLFLVVVFDRRIRRQLPFTNNVGGRLQISGPAIELERYRRKK